MFVFCYCFFFYKQKTAYEMRISDWSSDVCSSDLLSGKPIDLRVTVRAIVANHAQSGLGARRNMGTGVWVQTDKGIDIALSDVRTQEIGRASCRERVCQSV